MAHQQNNVPGRRVPTCPVFPIKEIDSAYRYALATELKGVWEPSPGKHWIFDEGILRQMNKNEIETLARQNLISYKHYYSKEEINYEELPKLGQLVKWYTVGNAWFLFTSEDVLELCRQKRHDEADAKRIANDFKNWLYRI